MILKRKNHLVFTKPKTMTNTFTFTTTTPITFTATLIDKIINDEIKKIDTELEKLKNTMAAEDMTKRAGTIGDTGCKLDAHQPIDLTGEATSSVPKTAFVFEPPKEPETPEYHGLFGCGTKDCLKCEEEIQKWRKISRQHEKEVREEEERERLAKMEKCPYCFQSFTRLSTHLGFCGGKKYHMELEQRRLKKKAAKVSELRTQMERLETTQKDIQKQLAEMSTTLISLENENDNRYN